MMCENCRERPATIHYSQMINGEFSEVHFCEGCAQAKGMGMLALGSLDPTGWMVGMEFPVPSGKPLVCRCGMTLESFQKTSFLGCSECYQTFHRELEVLLKRIHGASRHRGSVPVKTVASPPKRRSTRTPSSITRSRLGTIKALQRDLAKAIEEERFEEAAKLRDTIKQLSEHPSSSPSPTGGEGQEPSDV